MDQILPIIAIGVALVVGGVLAYLSYKAEMRRREALAALAGRLGCHFDPSRDRTHDEEHANFEIFRRGHSRAAFNTLRGRREFAGHVCGIKMGDFIYKVTSHTGKSRRTRTYRFSYLIVDMPWPALPDLLIRREHVLDKLAGAFGFDDIDFESAEFSRRYCVKSPDKKYAYDVIHPRMMELLMAYDVPVVDIERGRLCLSDGSKRWEPERFEAHLAWVGKFLEHWPEHVVGTRHEGAEARRHGG